MDPRRILVVDDEPDIVDLLREVLEQAGFEVHTAASAGGAIALVKEHIFDAALVDFNLPDGDGVMLHRDIRQMDAELAANTVFMSGFSQSDGNLDYYAAHGQGFLPKPFDVGEVLAALGRLWSGA